MSFACVVVSPVAVALRPVPALSVGVTSKGLVASVPEYARIAAVASTAPVHVHRYVDAAVSATVATR